MEERKRRVVFLCKGTTGDALPLFSIALGYQQQHATDEAVFACASSSLHGMETVLSGNGIKFFQLPIPQHPDLETAHKLASDEERLSVLKKEAAACLEAAQGADLIIFNLFTLEGYFIAQHLGVPSVVASPHILTRPPPSGFENRLAEAHPELYQRLKSAAPGQVSYAEVDHWMWRLFLDDFGQVCETLGLPSLPFMASQTQGLPPPTPLLYGISPSVLPRQPYWPESVSLCGYWVLPPSLQLSPDPTLVALIEGISSPLLFIGFGSMEMYMFDVNWEAVFGVLESALESSSMEAIFQCMQSGVISQAYTQLPTKPQRIHLWAGAIPHSWLFEKCSVILHHGGSGTAATALIAQRPQVICPVMFDQQFWAEHLSWEGLAHHCPNVKQLTARELTHAIQVALGSAVKRRIEKVGTVLSKENGLQTALTEIAKLMQT